MRPRKIITCCPALKHVSLTTHRALDLDPSQLVHYATG